MKTTQDRFFSKIEKTESCWVWQGSKTRGYGRFSLNGKLIYAHRVSLDLFGIDVPDGMVADHMCRNRACVNPQHLRIVTQKQNALENNNGVSATNSAKTHCPLGHELSDDNLDKHELTRGRRKCRKCKNMANNKSRNGGKNAKH